jgi:hypothetical protein
MILAILIFIAPLIGYAIFFYLIKKNVQKNITSWRSEIRNETLVPLKASIEELTLSRERLEKVIYGEDYQLLNPQEKGEKMDESYRSILVKRPDLLPIFLGTR